MTEANKLLKDTDDGAGHPIDRAYQRLKCGLQALPNDGAEFAMVDKFLQQTHADTHQAYRLELLALFAAGREEETKTYKPWASMHNRKLL